MYEKYDTFTHLCRCVHVETHMVEASHMIKAQMVEASHMIEAQMVEASHMVEAQIVDTYGRGIS